MSGHDQHVAIVGMACRFPGADDSDEYWSNIAAGKCSIRQLSRQELLAAGVNEALADDPLYVSASSHIADYELFDPAFFGVSSAEAMYMDPQRRLLLMCAQEALEQAGYASEHQRPIVGVYAGVSSSLYPLSMVLSRLNQVSGEPSPENEAMDMSMLLANGKDFASTYLSYRLNLTGPSVNVNTACSTSLVAVHQACRALASYDCDLALAGGASIFPYSHGYLYQDGGIQSRDGHLLASDSLPG